MLHCNELPTTNQTVVHQEPFQVVFCRKRGILFYIRGNHACPVHMERCIDSSCTSRCPLHMNNTPQRRYQVLFLYYGLPSVGMAITIRLPDIIKYLCSLCIISKILLKYFFLKHVYSILNYFTVSVFTQSVLLFCS